MSRPRYGRMRGRIVRMSAMVGWGCSRPHGGRSKRQLPGAVVSATGSARAPRAPADFLHGTFRKRRDAAGRHPAEPWFDAVGPVPGRDGSRGGGGGTGRSGWYGIGTALGACTVER